MNYVLKGLVARFLTLTIAAVVANCAPQSVRGEDAAADLSIRKVEIGIGGRFKIGKWTLARIEVQSSRPRTVRLVVDVSDPDGSVASFLSKSYELANPGFHQLDCLFKSGRLENQLRIRIRDDENQQVLAGRQVRFSNNENVDFFGNLTQQRARILTQSSFLVATLGKPVLQFPDEQSSQADGSQTESEESVKALQIVELDSSAQLPALAGAYDSLDALVISDGFDVEERLDRALQKWVSQGGHLVVAVGGDVEGYTQSSIYRWIGEFIPLEGQSRLAELSRLEAYAGSHSRLPFLGRLKAAKIRVQDEIINDPLQGEIVRPGFNGRVLVSGLDGPLLVRVTYGFGQITFFGLDLHRPPLSNWNPTGNIVRKILFGERRGLEQKHRSQGSRLTSSGITDLASQLHASQDMFPQVRRFSIWKVLGLIVLYLTLIGPVDYFVVHRWLKRPQWTWVTFPLIACAAVVLAAWNGRVSNTTELRLKQLDVVDIDVASQSTRTRSWLTVYSPETRRYQISVEPISLESNPGDSSKNAASEFAGAEPMISWSGIPESTFEGMYRPGGFEIGRPGYDHLPGATAVKDLPISIWSTKSLSVTWEGQTGPLVESRLVSSGSGQLSGTFTHHLKVPLDDWMLAYGNSVILSKRDGPLARLIPHRAISPASVTVVDKRELGAYLTNTTQMEVTGKSEMDIDILVRQMAYNPLDRNAFNIVRMLTFHKAVGGKSYTGLDNHSLRSSDLSHLLLLGRAVLFARMETPAARFPIRAGEDADLQPHREQTAVIRIVMPVKSAHSRITP